MWVWWCCSWVWGRVRGCVGCVQGVRPWLLQATEGSSRVHRLPHRLHHRRHRGNQREPVYHTYVIVSPCCVANWYVTLTIYYEKTWHDIFVWSLPDGSLCILGKHVASINYFIIIIMFNSYVYVICALTDVCWCACWDPYTVLPADCGKGYYLDRTASPLVCRQCAYDSYQDVVRMESCKPCPNNRVTFNTGTTDVNQCVRKYNLLDLVFTKTCDIYMKTKPLHLYIGVS